MHSATELTVIVLAAGLAAVVAAADSPAPAVPHDVPVPADRGVRFPTRLLGVGDARQLIVVTKPRGSRATLIAYEKRDDRWFRVHGPTPARIGRNGFERAAQRVQGSATTPAGSFALGPAFGQGTKPSGTVMPYRVVDGNDRWVYDRNDPGTYNTYQPWGNWRHQEPLAQVGHRRYRYAVVVGFNHPVMTMSTSSRPRASRRVDTTRGGGIFLHVTKSVRGSSHPTTGCVSVAEASMRTLLRWLRPTHNPRIVMGPRRWILKARGKV